MVASHFNVVIIRSVLINDLPVKTSATEGVQLSVPWQQGCFELPDCSYVDSPVPHVCGDVS